MPCSLVHEIFFFNAGMIVASPLKEKEKEIKKTHLMTLIGNKFKKYDLVTGF